MIELSKINKHYTTRTLNDSDVGMILELCQKNPLFYEHTEAKPTKAQIMDDMVSIFFPNEHFLKSDAIMV